MNPSQPPIPSSVSPAGRQTRIHLGLLGAVLIGLPLMLCLTAMARGASGQEILTPDERRWLTENQPRIVLAIETVYAPFVFLDAYGQPAGLAHDYLHLIEAKIGTTFKQRRFSSIHDIFETVHKGEVQIVNAVMETPVRSQFLTFTDAFIAVPNVILVRKDRSGSMRENSLSGLTVSLIRNYAVTEYLDKKGLGLIPNLVSDDLTALLNVAFGRSDATVIDLATASYLISQKSITNLRVAGEIAFSIRLAIGTPINEPVLHGILQKGLAAISDVERQEIHNRWINTSGPNLLTDWRFWAAVSGAFLVILATITLISIWNRMLRRQVKERTAELEKERLHLEQRVRERTAELTRSELRFRTIIDASPVPYALNDDQQNITYLNPAFIRTFGYAHEDIPTLAAWWPKAYPDPAYRQWVAENWRTHMEKAQQIHAPFEPLEVRIHSQNGGVRTVLVAAAPLGPSFEDIHLVTLYDISERKQAEDRLLTLNQELLHSNAELEQFSYAISHDMRQPLRMISSYLQLLQMSLGKQIEGEQREYFHFAIDGAKRLDAMLLGLLEYSRIGRKGEPAAWVESHAILNEALLFLQPAITDACAEVRIEGEWPRLLASPDELLRLIQNLIGNALKFRVAGRIPEVRVSSEIAGDHWRLSIADNGIGILPDQIGRLFQVFQRLQSRAAFEGTGIGLALCRKIVEHHGGRIWVESAGEGQGCTFFFTLPLPEYTRTDASPVECPP